jgi:membrane-bound ClpP family serine protease
MMEPLIWPLILLMLAIALIVLELFVPSGGLLSLLAGLAILASIIVAFSEASWVGVTILVIDVILIPVVIGAAIRWWPHTPIGRMVMITRPSSDSEVLPNTREYRLRETMLGKQGVAVSSLLPSGDVRIEGRVYDAISAGMPIDAGQSVVVVDARTHRLVVRPQTGKQRQEGRPADAADDVLSTPIDSLGLDPFDDPLA